MSAKDTLAGWLKDLGVDPSQAESAKSDARSAASGAISTLLDGVAGGLKRLSSLVFFLALTTLSLIFLLMIVTIAGGSLFGAAGLILAAQVTSAVVRISAPKTDAVPA